MVKWWACKVAIQVSPHSCRLHMRLFWVYVVPFACPTHQRDCLPQLDASAPYRHALPFARVRWILTLQSLFHHFLLEATWPAHDVSATQEILPIPHLPVATLGPLPECVGHLHKDVDTCAAFLHGETKKGGPMQCLYSKRPHFFDCMGMLRHAVNHPYLLLVNNM